MSLLLKYAVTALLVVIISEIAKYSDRLGALVSSLPLMSILVLFWLFVERQSDEKIAHHAFYTFWFVVGTLPFFLIFPWLLGRFYFPAALAMSLFITLILFYIYLLLLEKFGISLF